MFQNISFAFIFIGLDHMLLNELLIRCTWLIKNMDIPNSLMDVSLFTNKSNTVTTLPGKVGQFV